MTPPLWQLFIGIGSLAAVLVLVAALVWVGAKRPSHDNRSVFSGPAQSKSRLVPCPDCQRGVSKEAKTCPNCGKPLHLTVASQVMLVAKILMVIGAVIWVLVAPSAWPILLITILLVLVWW